jgi:hypothetical protein
MDLTATRRPDRGIDPALAELVRMAEEDGFTTRINLATRGGFVTGTILGRSQWVTAFMDGADTGEDSEPNRAALRAALHREETDGDPDEPTEYRLVHLVDAAVEGLGRLDPGNGSLMWRGRLSEVVGWHV